MSANHNADPTVMIIDDDDIDVRVICRALRRQGITNDTVIAHDGIEALEVLRAGAKSDLAWPWILLLDINMPKLNGHEFLSQIRADSDLKDSVVFILTTSDREQDMSLAYANNAAGYIVKSEAGTNFSELARLLQSYLSCVQFHHKETG